MKAILWQGQRIETDDRVADAVLELGRLLIAFRRTERIDFPARQDGEEVAASLVVGDGVGIGVLALPGGGVGDLDGAESALRRLHARIDLLDRVPGSGDFELPADFTVLDHDITN